MPPITSGNVYKIKNVKGGTFLDFTLTDELWDNAMEIICIS
jgi:hypothetical protein